ncbi:hypothetical protein BH11PLA2_BH11PLA2_34890 [soil metagenome]
MSDTATLKYPKSHRLRTTAEFKRVYDRKCSASNERLIVYALNNELGHPRLGCSVSRKAGNAVVRNRIKRLFREAFRQLQHELPDVDLVLLPRPGIEFDLMLLLSDLPKLATRANEKLFSKSKAKNMNLDG